jgi:hypothetical protein
MGSIYRPKYKNAAGELVEVSVWWLKYRADGRIVRESTEPKTTKESIVRGQLRVKEGDAGRGLPVVEVNRKNGRREFSMTWSGTTRITNAIR